MKVWVCGLAVLVVLAMGGWAGTRLVADGGLPGAPAATAPADDLLYEDVGAHSSATITQVLPNSNTSQLTLENVRRIRVKQDILIVEWGGTATTLLPRQFVSSVSINKRNPATAPAAVSVPTTAPAGGSQR